MDNEKKILEWEIYDMIYPCCDVFNRFSQFFSNEAEISGNICFALKAATLVWHRKFRVGRKKLGQI